MLAKILNLLTEISARKYLAVFICLLFGSASKVILCLSRYYITWIRTFWIAHSHLCRQSHPYSPHFIWPGKATACSTQFPPPFISWCHYVIVLFRSVLQLFSACSQQTCYIGNKGSGDIRCALFIENIERSFSCYGPNHECTYIFFVKRTFFFV